MLHRRREVIDVENEVETKREVSERGWELVDTSVEVETKCKVCDVCFFVK
jgi:hypothetical protein